MPKRLVAITPLLLAGLLWMGTGQVAADPINAKNAFIDTVTCNGGPAFSVVTLTNNRAAAFQVVGTNQVLVFLLNRGASGQHAANVMNCTLSYSFGGQTYSFDAAAMLTPGGH